MPTDVTSEGIIEGSGWPYADTEQTGSPTVPEAAIRWAASTATGDVYHVTVVAGGGTGTTEGVADGVLCGTGVRVAVVFGDGGTYGGGVGFGVPGGETTGRIVGLPTAVACADGAPCFFGRAGAGVADGATFLGNRS